jgi:Protein of unknown function (DUF1326)
MKKCLVILFVIAVPFSFLQAQKNDSKPAWNMNATAIEACSCPLFCQCYFNTRPAGHSEHGNIKHFCRSNMAYRINRGQYGTAQLDGTKFWISADIGQDFSSGEMEWAILTFDKATTPKQREGIQQMVSQLFPVKWKSFRTAEGKITAWSHDKDYAYASLDGGKTAEIKLKRFPGMTSDPVKLTNLKYWAAPRNDGFLLMQTEVEAYRVGPNAFEYKGTSGFVITVDMKSRDFARSTGGM